MEIQRGLFPEERRFLFIRVLPIIYIYVVIHLCRTILTVNYPRHICGIYLTGGKISGSIGPWNFIHKKTRIQMKGGGKDY